MLELWIFQHPKLHHPQSFASAGSRSKSFIITYHQLACSSIAHRPEAHHLTSRPCENHRPPQPTPPAPAYTLADAGAAGRHPDKFSPPQIEPRRFQRGENTVIAIFADPAVGS